MFFCNCFFLITFLGGLNIHVYTIFIFTLITPSLSPFLFLHFSILIIFAQDVDTINLDSDSVFRVSIVQTCFEKNRGSLLQISNATCVVSFCTWNNIVVGTVTRRYGRTHTTNTYMEGQIDIFWGINMRNHLKKCASSRGLPIQLSLFPGVELHNGLEGTVVFDGRPEKIQAAKLRLLESLWRWSFQNTWARFVGQSPMHLYWVLGLTRSIVC